MDHLRYSQLYAFDRDMNRTEDKYGWLAAPPVRTAHAHFLQTLRATRKTQKGKLLENIMTHQYFFFVSHLNLIYSEVASVCLKKKTSLIKNYLSKEKHHFTASSVHTSVQIFLRNKSLINGAHFWKCLVVVFLAAVRLKRNGSFLDFCLHFQLNVLLFFSIMRFLQ